MRGTVILIGNPVAGGGASGRIGRAASLLDKKGFDVRLMLTGKKGDAEEFAKEAVNSEPDTRSSGLLVIAAGGDGTYNEVANGLACSGIPMAVLPLGTTSVLARELNVPQQLEEAVEIAINGKAETVHLGKITCTEAHAFSSITRYFLLMAGIGFDGGTVFGVNEKIKRFTGKGAYILSGLKTLLRYGPEPLTITHGPGTRVSGYTVIVGKASRYGGNFRITPDACLTEPCFHVFLTHGKGRSDLIRYVWGVVRGRHLKFNDISYFRTTGLKVHGNAHIQIDGDYLGTAPAKIELAQNALRLVTPVNPVISS